jgi:hypothetical protein
MEAHLAGRPSPEMKCNLKELGWSDENAGKVLRGSESSPERVTHFAIIQGLLKRMIKIYNTCRILEIKFLYVLRDINLSCFSVGKQQIPFPNSHRLLRYDMTGEITWSCIIPNYISD